MTQHGRRKRWLITIGAVPLIAVLPSGAQAGPGSTVLQPGDSATTAVPPLVLEEAPAPNLTPIPEEDLGSEADLVLPPIPDDMSLLASTLMEEYADDPQFASAEVPRDRGSVVVHWYGEPSADLLEDISAADFTTRISPTAFEPGVLRAELDEVLDSQPAVTSGSVQFDGSGLTMTVDPKITPAAMQALQDDLEEVVSAPVELERQEVVAANNRNYDTRHQGGAVMYQYVNGVLNGLSCTSGFAVRNNANNAQGIMTAAHCGQIGSQWVIWGGPGSSTATAYGQAVSRSPFLDGLVLATGYSSPHVYNGGVASTTYAPVNGARMPFPGMELCYSGAYSGTKCGQVVIDQATYPLNSGQPRVEGWYTDSLNQLAGAGQGDSGGPAYQITMTTDGTKRWAVGIISAGANSTAEKCSTTGTPGGPERVCSERVYFTSVVRIGIALNVTVPTIPTP